MSIHLSGPLRGTWKNEVTGRQGDLLDLIRIEGKHYDDMTRTMEEAHAFLHGEAQAALRHDWKAHDVRALAVCKGCITANKSRLQERQELTNQWTSQRGQVSQKASGNGFRLFFANGDPKTRVNGEDGGKFVIGW